jgi:hypothetical protein
MKTDCKRRFKKWELNKKNMRATFAVILLTVNSKAISVLNVTILTGNVLNVDSSLQLQNRRKNALNAMRSVISLMLLAIPLNAVDPDILIRGYRYQSTIYT